MSDLAPGWDHGADRRLRRWCRRRGDRGEGQDKDSDVPIGQYGWLGVGADQFAVAKASFTGKPTGEPLARVAYGDVTDLTLTEGKLTLRADIELADGRHIAFETKRLGGNKPSVEVIELLRERCAKT